MKLVMTTPTATSSSIIAEAVPNMFPTIKHLVIGGGAHMGYAFYGSLKTLLQKQFFSMENIQTMYATSVGSIVAIMLLLDYDWEELDKYMIERPWHKLFTFNIPSVIQSFSRGGLYTGYHIQEIFKPLLLAKDIPMNITLQGFYDRNQVELHFITTRLEGLQLYDISHKTHPEWLLLDAVHATSSLPILFTPFESTEGNCFLDGAINMNYPMDRCIQDGHAPEDILGVNFHSESSSVNNTSSSYTSFKMFRFIVELFFQLWYRVREPLSESADHIPNQVTVRDSNDKLDGILDTLRSRQKRKYLIDLGKESAITFLQDKYSTFYTSEELK